MCPQKSLKFSYKKKNQYQNSLKLSNNKKIQYFRKKLKMLSQFWDNLKNKLKEKRKKHL